MNPIIHQYNRFAKDNQSLIQKALTSATNVGAALIPQNLEQIITDTIIRLSPELALAETKKIEGNYHEFNRITALPTRGGAMGENATTPATNSTSQRTGVYLKVIRRKSKITNFLQDASSGYMDTAAWEMQNHLKAHVFDLIWYMLYGNSGANTYEFGGLDTMITTNRGNQTVGGVVPTDLSFLDDMIDSSNRKGGKPHRRVFGMTPEMLSKISRLLTNVRLNQGLVGAGLSQVEIPGGWRMNAYRDIPIIETTSVGPTEVTTPVLTVAGEDTGVGSLANGAYFVRVAAVTLDGEQIATAESTVNLAGGTGTQRIKITLSAAHSGAMQYKVYCGTVSGSLTLKKIFTAYTYDADGTIVAVTNGIAGTDFYIASMTADTTTVPTACASDVPLVKTGGISPGLIYLWDLDPIQGLGKVPYTNAAGSQFNGLVTTEPLAKVDDYIQFLVKTYCALTPAFEATSCWSRGWRVA